MKRFASNFFFQDKLRKKVCFRLSSRLYLLIRVVNLIILEIIKPSLDLGIFQWVGILQIIQFI